MSKYIVKRILISILLLFFVAFIIYGLMRCLPTSYIETIARERSQQPGSKTYAEWMAQLSASYGLDKGIIGGFFNWLGNAIKGDFGDSWYYTIPVTEKFASTVGVSFIMGAISFFFELIIAIPLGIIAATKQYSRTDYIISIIALAGMSLPTFFFASLLKLVFSVKLGWFDLYGLIGRNYEQLNSIGKFFDKANHLVLPITTLVVISIGSLMRYTRTNMLEVLNADYIRTARAKGLSEKKVIYKHAFRNTMIPIVTLLAGILPSLFGGMMITEEVFGIPGIGRMAYKALTEGDIPFIMGYNMFLAILTVIGTLLSDIMYSVVDPRVKLGK